MPQMLLPLLHYTTTYYGMSTSKHVIQRDHQTSVGIYVTVVDVW